MKNKNKKEKSEEMFEEAEEIKVILVGDSGVGKTSLINAAQDIPFMEGTQISTMICTNVKLPKEINGKKYTIVLWDTIGQERFRSLTATFLKGSQIVIFVFDITNQASFEGLDYWFDLIHNELGDNIIRGIVGNKKDLVDDQEVDDDLVEQYAEKKGVEFKYCSALNSSLFKNFLEDLIKNYLEKFGKSNKDDDNGKQNKKNKKTKINKNKVNKKQNKCC